MNRFLPLVVLFVLFGLLGGAPAHAASDERHQLQQQRQAVEARYKRESQACQEQFQVNACMQGVRAERIKDLKPIQAREEELAALDRKVRAQDQAQRVADRQREFAAEEGRRRTEALKAAQAAATDGAAEIPPGRYAPPVDPEVHAKAITQQAGEAARAAAHEREQSSRRQRLVLQHQQDFQRRQDERETSGRKPGAPLPIPSAAEIAKAASAAASTAKH